MNRSDQDRLLREILSDDPAEFRRVSLEISLAALSRRRRQRSAVGAGLAAILMAVGLFVLLQPSRRDPTILVARTNRPSLERSAPTPDAAPPIKVLTDDELLALFPGRSVGLIGRPGHQTLTFFDAPDGEE